MGEIVGHMLDAPFPNLLIVAGLGFLAVGIIGKISANIAPGAGGRIMSGILGAILFVYGVEAHAKADRAKPSQAGTGQQANPEGSSGVKQSAGTQVYVPPPRVVVAAPPPAVAVAPDTCLQGYVWREAFLGDHVCVTPATRQQGLQDNQLAANRRSRTGGPYGPDTCLMGFVWREASPSDHVCVPGATRQQTAADNQAAASRRVGH